MARIVLFAGTYRIFWKFFNLPRRAKRNVANQYDLTDSLFNQFLDRRRQHSCGYFYKASDTLTDAQITKLAHLGQICVYSLIRKFWILAPNGVGLVHSIGVLHNAIRCKCWLNIYIFPGAIHPRLNK